MQTLLQRYRNTVDRSNTVRLPETKSVIPRRSISLRKTDSQTSVTKKPVERSNSRQSLVSSRSSLNSATSINTVKKMPLKSIGQSKTVPPRTVQNNTTIRKPAVVLQQPKPPVTIKRIPSGNLTNRPPVKSSFMKPTTSSTTKTHTPTTAPTGRLLHYRTTTLK